MIAICGSRLLCSYLSLILDTIISEMGPRRDFMLKLHHDSVTTSVAAKASELRSVPVTANADKLGPVPSVNRHTVIVNFHLDAHFQSLAMSKDHSNLR
jgi:hypothetical protein